MNPYRSPWMLYAVRLILSKKVRAAVFQPEFIEDLRFWVETDRKLAMRAFDLIEAILRDPFEGIGKPEPLRYLLLGHGQEG